MAERVIAGLACGDVLRLLGDLLDGELSAGDLASVRAHVAACPDCDRFGAAYGQLVRQLRAAAPAEPMKLEQVEAIVAKTGT